MDDENTRRYQGHDLAHLRVNYIALKNLELFAKVENLMDKRYATNSLFSVAKGEELSPGMPRTFYGGVRITL